MHTYHPSTWEVETGEYLQVGSQPGLHSYSVPTRVLWGKILSQQNKNKITVILEL